MADSIETVSAVQPAFSLTPTIMPLVFLPSQSDRPSGEAARVPVVSNSMATPSSKRYDERATTAINGLTDAPDDDRSVPDTAPDAEPAGHPSSASSQPLVASKHTGSEVGNADQLSTGPLEKSAAAQAPRSTASLLPLHDGFNGQSASGSASASTIETYDLPIAPRDTLFEQGKNTAVSSAAGLKPEIVQRDHPSFREVAAPSRPKSEEVSSAIHLAATHEGTQSPVDVGAGQLAAAPAAGIVQVPVNGTAASVNAHPSSMREPFVSIDAGADDAAAKWVHAAGHQAEAGFQDSSLGWVSVRAEAGAGGIHAAVVPSSEVAAQVLGSHLAGLNAHMASRYEHLNPVTVSAPDAGRNSRDTGREMSHGGGAGTSHGGQQRQMQEDPESARVQPAAHSLRGFADEPQSGLPMQAWIAGSNLVDGHVSFVV